ncbi:Hypothetical predicted protein [Olea europaea subsp. europaea]|uniref:Uncharacterized protein n=1 Tax=Olea europaea subsp. europaea TaxID=158383 RepID=A0A8S0VML2_OLEEU|nr:Hypothetical predicted protein [Olea europaea subsp. europaea]
MAMNLDDSGVGRVIFLWFLWQLLVEVNIAAFAIVMFPRFGGVYVCCFGCDLTAVFGGCCSLAAFGTVCSGDFPVFSACEYTLWWAWESNDGSKFFLAVSGGGRPVDICRCRLAVFAGLSCGGSQVLGGGGRQVFAVVIVAADGDDRKSTVWY